MWIGIIHSHLNCRLQKKIQFPSRSYRWKFLCFHTLSHPKSQKVWWMQAWSDFLVWSCFAAGAQYSCGHSHSIPPPPGLALQTRPEEPDGRLPQTHHTGQWWDLPACLDYRKYIHLYASCRQLKGHYARTAGKSDSFVITSMDSWPIHTFARCHQGLTEQNQK